MTVTLFNQGVRCAEENGRATREFIQWLRPLVDQVNITEILDDLAALSIVGNPTNAAADASAITAGTDGHVLRRSGTALAFGQLAIGAFADAIITFAKLQNFDALSVLGRSANSSGVGDEIAAGTDGHILRRSGTTLGFGKALTNFITGTATNDNATAGDIGEYVESVAAESSVGSWTTDTAKTITSISLSAGDWDVDACGSFTGTITGTSTAFSISTVDNTMQGASKAQVPTVPSATSELYLSCMPRRVSISGTTTIYLVGLIKFSAGTPLAGGPLRARRKR